MALSLSITKLPWKTQLTLFGVLALGAAGAFIYLYEMPARAEMKVQEAELATIQGRLEKGRETARRLPEFKRQVEENRLELDRLRGRLPEEKDAADLLRRIEGLARQSGLTIRAFKPQPVANKGMHAEWPISLELEGTYHNLGSFLDSVSKLPRLINVSKIDIKTRAKQEPNQTVAVTCTATTFVLLNGADAPGTAPGAPKKTE
jgi:type IV pilus assembly protein PilO